MSILSLKNISKNFGAIEALINVDLNLDKGQVVGLMGDNGAGKSTLVKIIAGVFQANSGEIIYNNQKVKFAKPIDARNNGIEVVYQDLALCDNLTAAANIFLSRELFKKFFYIPFLDYKKMYDVSKELFDELKSETRPKDEVKTMYENAKDSLNVTKNKNDIPKLLTRALNNLDAIDYTNEDTNKDLTKDEAKDIILKILRHAEKLGSKIQE